MELLIVGVGCLVLGGTLGVILMAAIVAGAQSERDGQ